ncbi:TIGR03618 family F420-dependent PPOX class oxidoreductase [Mumia sp. ZJ1417]|uniref:pyridoxamine 5'-phosphate oxidase family protein n=1 Tax=unclassified Mumia TaxID=2621872 RepID=UPI001421E4F9|nr:MULTISPECIES: TIGR03618 family F420-dependent PPOX class oxidoreductase [unclassified Mumia]QMW66728.1 TIGR03618 family F420-dependent PPOX class oxidoreductase [Mumia sp. ZJ1417]
MPRLAYDDPALVIFMGDRHLATLTTPRKDGTPHVVPVGVTYDAETRTARVITNDGSTKVRNIEAAGEGGARVALCHIDRGYWVTLEGVARVSRDPDEIAESVRRYAERYQQPRENPDRVTILVDVDRILGRLP